VNDAFAHQLKLNQIRDGERLDLVADERERSAIATRLGIPKLDRLDAHAQLSRTGDIVRATGRLMASLDQNCVVTNEPVPAHVDEAFDIMFVRPPETSEPDEEVELGASDCDVVFYDGGTIDLGSAIADSLALSLNPYPRSAGAEADLREAGVMTEAEASPFAILAQLKRGDSDKP
jgi:uncharacterized metal-binding protein YceD (DUF177 family)